MTAWVAVLRQAAFRSSYRVPAQEELFLITVKKCVLRSTIHAMQTKTKDGRAYDGDSNILS